MKEALSRKVTLEESKRIQLELMQKIHQVCQDHGLKYYLMFGSLLGAVRHKGFIPWDDDLDICMPREDYERFFDLYNQEQPGGSYAVNCCTDRSYYLPFGKVVDQRTVMKENVSVNYTLGVYVDIFPVDRLSEDPGRNAGVRKKILFWRKWMMIKFNPGSNKRHGWKKAAHTLLNKLPLPVDVNRLAVKIDRAAASLEDGPDGALAMLSNVDYYDIFREYEPGLFAERELVLFEDQRFWAPKERDKLLTRIYGDYMQLPSEGERLPHENTVWWKNDPEGDQKNEKN